MVRQPAATRDNVRVDERILVHYVCPTKPGYSTMLALVRPASLQFTPPGLPEGGRTLEYTWCLPSVGAVVRTGVRVEVWICGATCG